MMDPTNDSQQHHSQPTQPMLFQTADRSRYPLYYLRAVDVR
jgi:hypothetical protein